MLLEQQELFDVEGVYGARNAMNREIASVHFARLLEVFQANQGTRPYLMNGIESARRSLKHLALGLIAETGSPDIQGMIQDHLASADNLTDRLAAFTLLVESDHIDEKERSSVIQDFAKRWSHHKLVMDAWYSA